jgi:hypothetical protein
MTTVQYDDNTGMCGANGAAFLTFGAPTRR